MQSTPTPRAVLSRRFQRPEPEVIPPDDHPTRLLRSWVERRRFRDAIEDTNTPLPLRQNAENPAVIEDANGGYITTVDGWEQDIDNARWAKFFVRAMNACSSSVETV
jgi:hypothetical protein